MAADKRPKNDATSGVNISGTEVVGETRIPFSDSLRAALSDRTDADRDFSEGWWTGCLVMSVHSAPLTSGFCSLNKRLTNVDKP